MFYSDAILSKRGPLGRVWLAAHMERKLSKTQTLQTDISKSVDAIIGQEVEIMALRLSGQLLLGVVRIYNRKAKYLLDDCNEAMLKLKMAFRAGPVDMSNAQLAVDRNAITLQGDNLDLDVLLPDINWDIDFEDRLQQPPAQGQHVARKADVTLAAAEDFPFDYSDAGFGIDLGPDGGFGSQDFELDLGLDFGDGPASVNGGVDESVEVGRDAAAPRGRRESLDSHLLGEDGMDIDLDLLSHKSREASEHPFGADMDIDFGPEAGGMDLDLGIDFGDRPTSDREKTPGQTRSPTSPLTEPPMTPPPDFDLPEPGAAADEAAGAKVKKPRKEKKQIVDTVTELADGPGAKVGRGRNAAPAPKDNSAILAAPRFLPRSPLVMRLLEIRDDPLAHFLPTLTQKDGSALFCAAPPGLPPALRELFMRPVRNNAQPLRKRGASPEKDRAHKKARLADDDELEQALRAGSVAPSAILGSDVLGRGSVAPGGLDFDQSGMGIDDFQLDIPEFGGVPDIGMPERAGSVALTERSRSRMSTPGAGYEEGEESYADASCPIAAFDVRHSQQTQTQPEVPDSQEDGKGYSKNTVKALTLIRKELQPSEEDEEEEEKVLSFRKMSEKASRRAASSFFFEMLVLATRDCIKVNQAKPFQNIEVRATDKLWERQRHASAAPSLASAMGL